MRDTEILCASLVAYNMTIFAFQRRSFLRRDRSRLDSLRPREELKNMDFISTPTAQINSPLLRREFVNYLLCGKFKMKRASLPSICATLKRENTSSRERVQTRSTPRNVRIVTFNKVPLR